MLSKIAASIFCLAAGSAHANGSKATTFQPAQPYAVTMKVSYAAQPAKLGQPGLPVLPVAIIRLDAPVAANHDVLPRGIGEQITAAQSLVAPIATMSSNGGGSAEGMSAAGQNLADLKGGAGAVSAGEPAAAPQPSLAEQIAAEQPRVKKYYEQIRRVIVGQEAAVDLSLVSLLSHGGHLLLEGMPGLGKTKLVETISTVSGLSSVRIQFRTDMTPADIVGFQDKDEEGKWKTKWGPITKANIVQADEINRGTPRAKSALLQPMQEGRATIDDETKTLAQPNRVLATMNPIDTEGVFPMLEPEKDRFLISAFIDYPTKEQEKRIAREQSRKEKVIPEQVFSEADINRLSALIERIPVSEILEDYIQDIVRATRPPSPGSAQSGGGPVDLKGNVKLGAGPRASIAMMQVARVYAFLAGRAYVTADDVQKAALPVLRHRIKLTAKGKNDGVSPEAIIAEILKMPIPR